MNRKMEMAMEAEAQVKAKEAASVPPGAMRALGGELPVTYTCPCPCHCLPATTPVFITFAPLLSTALLGMTLLLPLLLPC